MLGDRELAQGRVARHNQGRACQYSSTTGDPIRAPGKAISILGDFVAIAGNVAVHLPLSLRGSLIELSKPGSGVDRLLPGEASGTQAFANLGLTQLVELPVSNLCRGRGCHISMVAARFDESSGAAA